MSTARCAYCLWQLTEHDDAVACPECSTPYHRDCYAENDGCSTFGCAAWIQTQGPDASLSPPGYGVPVATTYSTEVAYEPAHAPATGPFCTNCGQRGEPDDRFCPACGTALVTAPGV